MSVFNAFLGWVQATTIARTVADSLLLTAALSSIHLIGFTLVMGGAVVSHLRLLGILLPRLSVLDVAGPASRGMIVGLAISVATGLLLFAPRATAAAGNGFFQLKMSLLVAAAGLHFTMYRQVIRRMPEERAVLRLTGAAGLALWFGVAAAGCAFILLE